MQLVGGEGIGSDPNPIAKSQKATVQSRPCRCSTKGCPNQYNSSIRPPFPLLGSTSPCRSNEARQMAATDSNSVVFLAMSLRFRFAVAILRTTSDNDSATLTNQEYEKGPKSVREGKKQMWNAHCVSCGWEQSKCGDESMNQRTTATVTTRHEQCFHFRNLCLSFSLSLSLSITAYVPVQENPALFFIGCPVHSFQGLLWSTSVHGSPNVLVFVRSRLWRP